MGFISIMNKTLFLCLCFSLALFSCQKNDDKLTQDTSGAINTISVIVDDQLWNGEVGDSIRNKFAAPVLGLPQEEPLFSINQYPVKLFEGFSTDSRNIIIIKKESKNKKKEKEFLFITESVKTYVSLKKKVIKKKEEALPF